MSRLPNGGPETLEERPSNGKLAEIRKVVLVKALKGLTSQVISVWRKRLARRPVAGRHVVVEVRACGLVRHTSFGLIQPPNVGAIAVEVPVVGHVTSSVIRHTVVTRFDILNGLAEVTSRVYSAPFLKAAVAIDVQLPVAVPS